MFGMIFPPLKFVFFVYIKDLLDNHQNISYILNDNDNHCQQGK